MQIQYYLKSTRSAENPHLVEIHRVSLLQSLCCRALGLIPAGLLQLYAPPPLSPDYPVSFLANTSQKSEILKNTSKNKRVGGLSINTNKMKEKVYQKISRQTLPPEKSY